MRKAISWPVLWGVLLFLALASIMYRSTMEYLLSRWGMDDFTYSYFLPLVAAYLVWERREELALEPGRRSWTGLLPALLGVLLFWVGELGGEFTAMFLSLWLLGVGVLWSMLGGRKLRLLAFPLFLVLAMVPPPAVLYHTLTLQLKLLSSQIGVLVLQMFGYSAYREGNVIDLGFIQLEVVDACSGLRYLFPLIIMGVLLAYFHRGAWWKKGVIVISTIPVSVLTNSMRIASVGMLYPFMGAAAAEGFFHDFSGWFIFMMSLGMLLLEIAVLKKLFPDRVDEGTQGGKRRAPSLPGPRGGGRAAPAPQLVVLLLLMGASAAAVQGVSDRNRTPMKRPFSTFPVALGEWTGVRQSMERLYLDELQLSDYLLADFRNSRGDTINCYVAFSDHQTKGKASHSPSSCLPGSGWELKEPAQISVADGSGRILCVNRALMVMGGERRLTYYWFGQRGRTLTDLYQVKLYNFLDSVAVNRTDGALVRLITPLREGEAPQEADARLREFLREFNPALERHLPAGSRS